MRPKAGVVWSLGAAESGRGAAFVQFQAELEDVRQYGRRPAAFRQGELLARDWSEADLKALLPVVEGRTPLAASVDRASDIVALLDVAAEQKLRLILVGASEGWLAAEKIAGSGIPVILDVTENLPSNFDQIGATLENARRLNEAGVTIVIQGKRSGHEAGQLRYFAGLAVAHGLPYAAALKAVTVNPARVWGEKNFGALAVGQDADIAIWEGDPFEPLTDLSALYIRGERQSLRSRQNMLEEKYIGAAQHNSAERDAR
jgi:imidazolonepropionase-like amidohydrolase